MAETRTIRYHGHPATARALVQILREEGVQAEIPRPAYEDRSLPQAAADVVIGLVAAGAYDAIKVAVARFRKRFPDTEVTIEGDDAE